MSTSTAVTDFFSFDVDVDHVNADEILLDSDVFSADASLFADVNVSAELGVGTGVSVLFRWKFIDVDVAGCGGDDGDGGGDFEDGFDGEDGADGRG